MADSSVPITAGSGTPIRVLTGLGAGSADQQVVTLADSAGNLLGTTAAPLPVSNPNAVVTGNITAASGVAAPTLGTFTSTALAANSSVSASCDGAGTVMIGWSGNSSANLLYLEGTVDGTNWLPVYGSLLGQTGLLGFAQSSATVVYRVPVGGLSNIRVRSAASWTASTVSVTIRASAASSSVMLADPLPTGANTIGTVGVSSGATIGIANGANQASVKSASTSTVATDFQLVVGLHPSSPLPAGTNVVGTVNTQPSPLVVSTTAAVTTALTATLPAVAAQFHYIVSIQIQRYAGAALTGAAAPVVVTTTNLPGSLAWSFDTAAAIGTSQIQLLSFAGNPLKSSTVNTATTIVAPLVTNGLWRINVVYYTAT